MLAGFIVLFVIRWYALTGFTWYAFAGAAVTAIVAHVAALSPGSRPSEAR
jgi:hypothetical protein